MIVAGPFKSWSVQKAGRMQEHITYLMRYCCNMHMPQQRRCATAFLAQFTVALLTTAELVPICTTNSPGS